MFNGYRVFTHDNMCRVRGMDGGDGHITTGMYLTLLTVYLTVKMVNGMCILLQKISQKKRKKRYLVEPQPWEVTD